MLKNIPTGEGMEQVADRRETNPPNKEPTQLMPQVSRQRFPTLGNGLDDWCAQVKLPSSIAICVDPNPVLAARSPLSASSRLLSAQAPSS
jgi:hypothetical protein